MYVCTCRIVSQTILNKTDQVLCTRQYIADDRYLDVKGVSSPLFTVYSMAFQPSNATLMTKALVILARSLRFANMTAHGHTLIVPVELEFQL